MSVSQVTKIKDNRTGSTSTITDRKPKTDIYQQLQSVGQLIDTISFIHTRLDYLNEKYIYTFIFI